MAATDTWFDHGASAFNLYNVQRARYDEVLTLTTMVICGLTCLAVGTFWIRPDQYHPKLFEKPQQRAGVLRSRAQSNNLSERLKTEGSNMAILWASQSGTAERLAGRLAKELRRNFSAKVSPIDISDVSPASLLDLERDTVVIFIVSTFGEGDPSDNLRQLWSWFRESDQTVSMSNIGFLAFGLGNSNYKYYNHVVDVLVQQLLSRGARMLMDTGKADDAAGETEEHFISWKQEVFDFFRTDLHYQQREARYEPDIQIIEDASLSPGDLWSGSPYIRESPSTQSKAVSLPVTRKDIISQFSGRTCLHIDLDTSRNLNQKYKTGDYLCVWPVNPLQEVRLLLRVLGLEDKQSTPIIIRSLDRSKLHLPSPTTFETTLQSYLEICAPMSRDNVAVLSSYAPSATAKEFLMTIANDKSAYAAFSKTQYLNLGRLLNAACSESGAWAGLPFSLVLEMLPPMKPRSYSISSSSVVSPRQISITVAVSDTTTLESPHRAIGLATNYLSSAGDGHHPLGLSYGQVLECGQVYAAIRRSSFKLPIGSSTPIIMVGAGTGVAPFRAFVQERARLKSIGRDVGMTKLFFGCRNISQDFLYADDFAKWGDQLGHSFSLTTACSRPDNGRDKRYVQDAILKNADAVCKLLVDENAYFYICGAAAMARDVSAAIAEVLKSRKQWTGREAEDFADRQKRQRRWLQDVWG